MKKIIALVVCMIFVLATFCGCADETTKNKVYKEKVSLEESDVDLETDVIDSRKLIKEISLSVETKDYDNYIANIRKNVTSSGGYIESSNEFTDDDFRSFTATIRVPVGETDSFTEFASKGVIVTERSESVEDVTEQYVDIEARIKVYEAEEESLLEIMKQADNVTDVISVEERIAAVRAQIESYTAQLKSLENQTDYCTINLDVVEVEREVENEGYWSSIWNNIVEGFEDVGDALVTLFALFLSIIPYLLVPGVATIVTLVIIRYFKKKKNSNKKQ
ncbi:MAG: DUF4349 domain-containing protein [Clostridia bacterium]|nr:DUF4349 domain-containing protein [Clostridia bacterium]